MERKISKRNSLGNPAKLGDRGFMKNPPRFIGRPAEKKGVTVRN
jgi:hypothetical protein